MKRHLMIFGLLFNGLVLSPIVTMGAVRMPPIFSEHMVLQRSAATPVWGWANAGEKIKVSLATASAETVAGKDGKWKVTLDLTKCPAGPDELVIQDSDRLVIKDVVVGEVWLASGQSNMALPLKNTMNAEQEISRSADPFFRDFHVDSSSRDGCTGKWAISGSPDTGNFYGVSYYFAKALRREIAVPVGIIDDARNGTEIEAWMSSDAIAQDAQLEAGTKARKAVRAAYQEKIAAFHRELPDWFRSHGRPDPGCTNLATFAAPEISTPDWTPVTLPGPVTGAGLPECGVVWVRKEINITPAMTNETIKLMLGVMDGFDTVYWNGEKIAETPPEKFPGTNFQHYYFVPPALIKPGKAVIAVRIYSPVAAPAFTSREETFWVGPIRLGGRWLAKTEVVLPPPSVADLQSLPQPPQNVIGSIGSELFNTLIAPMAPYGVAGLLWYQGEGNAGRAVQYRKELSLLIKDWRRLWGQELPFYICQLANNLDKKDQPSESGWAELREAQSMALALPATGQAVLIDTGEERDLHSRNKRDAGERLAHIALAKDYGKKIVYSGPVYSSMKVEGKTLRLDFHHTEGGLMAKPLPARYDVRTLTGETAPLVRHSPAGELEGFAICGKDHQWVWASAKINGDSVIVWSDKIPAPVAVRYGWADNPTCNLFNGAGLPASPFRTDDFPASTRNNTFGLH